MDILNNQKKLLVVIAGPTAVGKTALSIELAKKYQAPVLSFDSRQFYKEMNIGTAKPDANELNQAAHYFISNLSIHDKYTSGKFETDALILLNQLFEKHPVVIAVGGSGLYINALCYGIDDIPTSEEIRNSLITEWKENGLEPLQEQLKLADPDFYKSADIQNPRRVIRALEVFRKSGLPYSSFRKNQNKKRMFETLWIGLELERDQLFEKINKRVDDMMEQGLFEESKELYPFKDQKALKTVGYQELFDYLDGKHDFSRAVELIKRNTRVFAKKQMVWFKRNPEINWVSPNEINPVIELIDQKILQ
ncbi:MAG: tRNA (adenosine(37)-N6)-dimethylallyltransferase MiaA [Crocinitomicaceae bacterium]|nr:tRNA (adenosine(37)-N6)-dimethylallyltransferase MiaA [Crocinitomicaceae bacterium]